MTKITDSTNQQMETKTPLEDKVPWKMNSNPDEILSLIFFFFLSLSGHLSIKSILLFILKFKLHRIPLSVD